MDTEMIMVNTNAGEGATSLHTFECAHTKEEADKLANATTILSQRTSYSPDEDVEDVAFRRPIGDVGNGTNGIAWCQKTPTFKFELKVGTLVQVPERGEGTIRPAPNRGCPSFKGGQGTPLGRVRHRYHQGNEGPPNKYTVQLVADNSIVSVPPGDVKVAVPVTGLQVRPK